MSLSIILLSAYGYACDPRPGKDPLIRLVDTATDQFSAATKPGAFLVDIAPVLRYLPPWVPGAGFKRLAEEWNKKLQETCDVPFSMVKEEMVRCPHCRDLRPNWHFECSGKELRRLPSLVSSSRWNLNLLLRNPPSNGQWLPCMQVVQTQQSPRCRLSFWPWLWILELLKGLKKNSIESLELIGCQCSQIDRTYPILMQFARRSWDGSLLGNSTYLIRVYKKTFMKDAGFRKTLSFWSISGPLCMTRLSIPSLMRSNQKDIWVASATRRTPLLDTAEGKALVSYSDEANPSRGFVQGRT